MVGGVVIGLSRRQDRTHVHVADCPHQPKHGRGDECPRPDTCCVYTDEVNDRTGEKVEVAVGDSFWWQSGSCYWTPKANRQNPDGKAGVDYDIRLKKIGYSH
jgi:hypothetical protein